MSNFEKTRLGGNGHPSSSTSRYSSLDGQPAISVNSGANFVALSVGEGVTVKGGDGAEYSGTASGAGKGAAGLSCSSASVDFTLFNAGTIAAGNGGAYSGSQSYLYGGDGGTGVYWYSSASRSITVTNAATGVIAGGDGGDLRYKLNTSSVGSRAGYGGAGLSVSTSGTKALVNDGLIVGGNGGNSPKTSGTVATGGTASSIAQSANSTGTLRNGSSGIFNQLSTIQSLFPGSTVTRDAQTGIYTVTLQQDYSALTLPDNLGDVTINMNGHTIAGTSSAAAVTFSAKKTAYLPTRLTLTGTGSIVGFDGASSATGAGGNGTPAFSLPANTAAVSIDVGADVTVCGGNGGDSTTTAGTGAPAVQKAAAVSCTVTGRTVDGQNGTVYENALALLFPGANFAEDEAGNPVITLMEDVTGPVSVPNNLGPVTLDLNGHSIRGKDGQSYASYGAALQIVSATPNETPTVLTITGTGAIVGGTGANSASSSQASQGGYGIYVNAPNVTLVLGENVVVQGGDGGENTSTGRDGLGGIGLYTSESSARFTLDNFGTIRGGCGVYGSSTSTGFGMANMSSGYGNIGLSITNEATGWIVGGAGRPGSAGSIGLYANVSDSEYVNLGTIRGGEGGEGGCNGGGGIYPRASSYYPSTLINEGTISGGDGSDAYYSGGVGGEVKISYGWGNFNYSGDGQLLAGKDGKSMFEALLQEELGSAISVSQPAGDSYTVILTLEEDLHETLVLDPSAWGFDGSTIEIDMNGHSIYGTDGTAEHPDGQPGILCDDENFDFGARYSGLQIYDSTMSSNSVIRGGNGYSSSTGEPAGNGGDGITAPNAGLDTPVVGDIDGIQIWGGDGGDNTGTGDGGNGGCAIRGRPYMLQDVEFHGGDGGDAITGNGGNGGDAILGFIGTSDIGGNIWLYGGNGGNSLSGDGGNGGHGQHSNPYEDDYYFTCGIFYTGGDGGSSIDGDGGDGGHGLWGFAGEWNGGTVLHGGDGGTSVNGDGGNGGDGLRGDGESISMRDPHEATGGNGGASENGMGGNGGNGVTYIPYDGFSHQKAEEAATWRMSLDVAGGEGADGFFRGLGGSGVAFGEDPHQGGEELNVSGGASGNGEDGKGKDWVYTVTGPGILDWKDMIDDPWIANTYIGETNAYLSVSIDGGEPIQVRYNDTDGQYLPEQIVFGGELDTVHTVVVHFNTSTTRIRSTRPTGSVKDWDWKPYDIDIKVPATHPESEPFSLVNLGTVPADEEVGKTILCDARIDTTANLSETGRQLDSTVNPAPTNAPTTGTMDYWYVAQNPRNPGDATDTLAMTAPTLSAGEPTSFTVDGIEGLSEFSWEMFLSEGKGTSVTNGNLTLTVVKTLDGVATTNTYTYTAADLENGWKDKVFRFDGPETALYAVTFTYTNNSDGDGQALVDNIYWKPLGASLMIVDHDDPGDGYVYLAFQPQFNRSKLQTTSVTAWRQHRAANGFRAKRGATRLDMEKCAPESVQLSDLPAHTAATDRVWVKVPLGGLDQDKGYWRVTAEDPELGFKDTDGTLVYPPALRSGSAEEDARSVNVFGLIKVESATTNTLVAVPWTWYSAQEKNATHLFANKLVKTTNLTDGDSLYAHVEDGDGLGHYAAWTLEDGHWTAVTTIPEGGADGIASVLRTGDDTVRVPRGNGVWLVRQRPFEVVGGVTNPVPFWVYGQSVTNAVETRILPGPGGTYADGSVKAHSTILGNPYGQATRVNDLNLQGTVFANGVQGDCIVVPCGASAEKRLYRGFGPQPGQWCWMRTELVRGRPMTTYDYDVTVPAGHAFWYERRGTTDDLKVVWPYRPDLP